MTSATSPSLEDLLRGCLPGMPPLILYNPMLAYENGEDFMRAFHDAAAGRLEPFILVLEGSVPNEEINGEGHWAASASIPRPASRSPPTPGSTGWRRGRPLCWRSERARRTAGSRRCATTRPARWACAITSAGDWESRRGIPIVNLPGCPVQPDNITETLLALVLHVANMGPLPELDAQGRPRRMFSRTVHETCNRAGLAEAGEFSGSHGDGQCLVKLGCKGPVVKCNVPIRGWSTGIGGCPNVGGICMACTMPGFPDKYMPFVEPDIGAKLYAHTPRIANGPLVRFLRERRIRHSFDVEPRWRQRGSELTSGYHR